MKSPVGREAVDIRATYLKNRDIVPNLLAVHGMTGCDTVAQYHTIAKTKAVNDMTDCNLVLLGNVHAPRSSILKQATKLIAKCYGISSDCETMTECRLKVWAKRVGTA